MNLRSALGAALQAGIVIAATGALGFAANQPWLFPSLAPTAVLQAQPTRRASARRWNAVVGHCCGVLFGSLSVILLGAQHAPGVLASGHLSFGRVVAASLAIALTMLSSELAHAEHAPAASTTLLFAEGSYRPTVHDVLLVLAGIALTVALGEVLRRGRTSRRKHRAPASPPLCARA